MVGCLGASGVEFCLERGQFPLVGGSEGAPEDVSLAVSEENDDLTSVGDLKLPAEAIFVDVERHDPGP